LVCRFAALLGSLKRQRRISKTPAHTSTHTQYTTQHHTIQHTTHTTHNTQHTPHNTHNTPHNTQHTRTLLYTNVRKFIPHRYVCVPPPNMSGYRLHSFELLIGIPLSWCPLRDHTVLCFICWIGVLHSGIILCCVSPVGCTSLSDSEYEYEYYCT
jgi:hypothetical protein